MMKCFYMTKSKSALTNPRELDSNVQVDVQENENPQCPLCYTSFDDEDDNEENKEEARNDDNGIFDDCSHSSIQETVDRVQITGCHHVICRSCLTDYCSYCLSIHKVPIPCPAHAGHGRTSHRANADDDDDAAMCAGQVPPDLVRQLFVAGPGTKDHSEQENDENTKEWRKYWRLWRLAADSSLVACPGCLEPVSTTITTSGPTDNDALITSLTHTETTTLPDCEQSVVVRGQDEVGSDTKLNNISMNEATVTVAAKVEKTNSDEAAKQLTCSSCCCVFCPKHQFALSQDKICVHCESSRRQHLAVISNLATVSEPTTVESSNPKKFKSDLTSSTLEGVSISSSSSGSNHMNEAAANFMSHEDLLRIVSANDGTKLDARPCSHCGAFLWKADGCDHVVCPVCHNDMCFQCGTHVHLSGKVIRHCANCRQGFIDHRYNEEYKQRLCLLLPILLPGWILYSIGASLVALLSCCFCCCFGCGTQIDSVSTSSTVTPPASTLSTSSTSVPFGDGIDSIGTEPTSKSSSGVFAPLLGLRKVFVWMFMPFVVCFRDLGCDACGACLEGMLPDEFMTGGGGSDDENHVHHN